ncbi:hypothetical protein PXH59_00790 [Xenorhabdus sp. SF857]|uniref:hypothetical protein n=1 Tax=Xenorhabdus bakwenae TaxID=3026967 RepID=UPI00255839DB|nr:hypothetical protein [Xenorhabdus sp. SF857]WFQ79777.1 hypothetical protein PXH59_00740 [Xenorhabdus sp. SF857]WFQ79787.1 hypothetical protein PXH59_00790 [Xenorhabdus sp. SF857]
MAGLPVGLRVRGGTWAMVGLTPAAPVQSVQAAQSPLNIMLGNYAKLAVQPRSPPLRRRAARIA